MALRVFFDEFDCTPNAILCNVFLAPIRLSKHVNNRSGATFSQLPFYFQIYGLRANRVTVYKFSAAHCAN